MPRLVAALVIASCPLLAAACASSTTPEPAPVASAPPPAPDDFHVQLPVENVRDVMRAKLAHAYAVLEAVALQDFPQVEANAQELHDLSREAGWRVHSTVAYGILSDEFGGIASALADSARARDIDAVSRDYLAMVESCLGCHRYLREEGPQRDAPGRISLGR